MCRRFFILMITICIAAAARAQYTGYMDIVERLLHYRNRHLADSAEALYADTVKVYMSTLRNIPRATITRVDKVFWKRYPANKFVITAPIEIKMVHGIYTAIIYGDEYLDGTNPKKERIELRFSEKGKIDYFRARNVK